MLAVASTIAISLFAIAMILLTLDRTKRPAPKPSSTSELDTIAAWPPQAVRVLTLEERQAFDVVRTALPKHLVLAQVPLARFISVPTHHSYLAWLQRVGRLSVDILITDASSRPIAAVEIHSDQETPRSQKRHSRIAAVLQAAGIPVHVWREGHLPTADAAYRQIRGESAGYQGADSAWVGAAAMASSAAATATQGAVDDDGDTRASSSLPLPVAEVHELLADGDARYFGQSHDPVASTFFDDLDFLGPDEKT